MQTLLCALDTDLSSQPALTQAADLARRTHSTLHLLHIDPLFYARLAMPEGVERDAAFRDEIRDTVNRVLGAPEAFEVLAPVLHRMTGTAPSDGILATAKEIGADLIVVGSHLRRGLTRVLLGSVADDVLLRSPTPVLVASHSESALPGPEHPVLIAIDFSEASPATLRWGVALADAYGAPVELVHALGEDRSAPADLGGLFTLSDLRVSSRSSGRTVARRALHVLAREAGLDHVGTYVAVGTPPLVLSSAADRCQAGLVVVGTHGRTGWDRSRLGSIAAWTVQYAPCSVLVTPVSQTATPPSDSTENRSLHAETH